MQKLSPQAYEALSDALSKVFWRKTSFQRHLKLALRDHSELLASLPFEDTKRVAADELISRLAHKEHRYRDLTLGLMADLSAMDEFPDLIAQRDKPELLPAAEESIARLKRLVGPYLTQKVKDAAAQAEAERRRAIAQAEMLASTRLAGLRDNFLRLEKAESPQQRGRDFERLLHETFEHYDLEPRLAYVTASDQIDGAFSYDTDVYILEAKWTKGPIEREDADVFQSKVARMGKNGLGLFISIGGFSTGFRETYARSTPFITADGNDLFLIFDGRVRLDELLRMKKRHANETGSCFYPAANML